MSLELKKADMAFPICEGLVKKVERPFLISHSDLKAGLIYRINLLFRYCRSLLCQLDPLLVVGFRPPDLKSLFDLVSRAFDLVRGLSL